MKSSKCIQRQKSIFYLLFGTVYSHRSCINNFLRGSIQVTTPRLRISAERRRICANVAHLHLYKLGCRICPSVCRNRYPRLLTREQQFLRATTARHIHGKFTSAHITGTNLYQVCTAAQLLCYLPFFINRIWRRLIIPIDDEMKRLRFSFIRLIRHGTTAGM